MSFDLRPRLKLDSWYWQVNQKQRADANWNENCVPTSFALCCLAYGINPGDPQAWTAVEYGANYHGPEEFSKSIAYVGTHFPNAPAVANHNPLAADLPGAIDSAGKAGCAMVAAWYCDCATVTIGAGADCGHASLPVAFDGTHWTILNVWDGRQQVFTTAQLQQIYMGGLAVFQRSLIPAPAPAPVSNPLKEKQMIKHLTAADGSDLVVQSTGSGGIYLKRYTPSTGWKTTDLIAPGKALALSGVDAWQGSDGNVNVVALAADGSNVLHAYGPPAGPWKSEQL